MASSAQHFVVIAKQDVRQCKFCGAEICWQVGWKSGKKYPTNVYVVNGQSVTQHTNFHNCTQAEREAYQQRNASLFNGASANAPKLDMTGVNALFDTATAHGLKWPKIRLITPSGQAVALARATTRSRYPGQIMVTDGGSFGSNIYFGRVDKTGEYLPTDKSTAEIRTLLEQLGADPAKVAAGYGKLTGNCCFCHRRLEDARSTEVGYGPVCADKFGLPWGVISSAPPQSISDFAPEIKMAPAPLESKQGPWSTLGGVVWTAEASSIGDASGKCPVCGNESQQWETKHDREREKLYWHRTCPCGVELVIFND